MKKALKIIGIFILLGVVGFSILNYFGTKFDKESKAYVDKTVPIIIANWDADQLVNYSHPNLLKSASPEKIKALLNMFSESLGNLKEYKGSKGQAGTHIDRIERGLGIAVTGEYISDADFEKAPAKIQILLLKQDNKWQILGFQVISDALIQ